MSQTIVYLTKTSIPVSDTLSLDEMEAIAVADRRRDALRYDLKVLARTPRRLTSAVLTLISGA